MKIFCLIPARIGSKRLKKKNLLKINNKSLIERNILRCKKSKVFNQIFINSDSTIFKKYALKNKINFYYRNKKLGNDKATSEDYIFDFLEKICCDYVVQVHSIAAALKINTIKNFVKYLKKKKPKILLSYDEVSLETFFGNKPINFKKNRKINSQSLKKLKKINWSISAWERNSFLKNKENKISATYAEKIDFFKISPYEGMVIKTMEDLSILRKILK